MQGETIQNNTISTTQLQIKSCRRSSRRLSKWGRGKSAQFAWTPPAHSGNPQHPPFYKPFPDEQSSAVLFLLLFNLKLAHKAVQVSQEIREATENHNSTIVLFVPLLNNNNQSKTEIPAKFVMEVQLGWDWPTPSCCLWFVNLNFIQVGFNKDLEKNHFERSPLCQVNGEKEYPW